MAAEVHEGKEAEQSVIVGIEIAVLKGFVACLQRASTNSFLLACWQRIDAAASVLTSPML